MFPLIVCGIKITAGVVGTIIGSVAGAAVLGTAIAVSNNNAKVSFIKLL